MDSKLRSRAPLPSAGSQGADGLPGPPPTPSRRDSDHHREVQQLYEEMEQQIRQDKQQLQAEVGSPHSLPPFPSRLFPWPSSGAGDWAVWGSGRSLGVDPLTALIREMGWGVLSLSPLPVSAGVTVSPEGPSARWVCFLVATI